MKDMTLHEFLRNTRRALDSLRRGERILLTHRGEPVARLEPLDSEPSGIREDDSLLRIEDFAMDGPGGIVPKETIDRIVYGV